MGILKETPGILFLKIGDYLYDTKTGVIYYQEWTEYRTTVSLCSTTGFSFGVDENRVKWMPTHDNYVAFKPVLCKFFDFYEKIFLFEFIYFFIEIFDD